ncbi:MAG: hypothetical protein AB8B65_16090, partial [Kordia sp.]|uniref:hypothetical protein n=1 Tax=Kordia sp. TaxID=1965332 RepID=UPI00385A800B
SGNACCGGSLMVMVDCNGVVQRSNNYDTPFTKRNAINPCNDGDVGVIIDGFKSECEKIEDLFTEYENYKQRVVGLNDNVNLNHETAVGIYENGTEFEFAGDENNYLVNLPENPESKYRTFAHVHNEFTSATDTITTYSVFSPGDLQFVAKRMLNDKVHNDFVGFLTTGKGTQYAFTINNRTKFKKFFKYLEYYDQLKQGESLTAEEFTHLRDVIEPLFEKYFDKEELDNVAPIRVVNTNNHAVLLAFVNFLKEADLGITLFESDISFTTFKKVSANEHGTNIVRENCGE